jgi:hypothetical protein
MVLYKLFNTLWWNQSFWSFCLSREDLTNPNQDHCRLCLHRKKRFRSFPSPAGMSLTKLPLGRNNSVMTSLFPPRESLVVTSRLGTGNSRTFFLRWYAPQMKGWWESNINGWFPFLYFQKWNCAACYFQNRIRMWSVSQFLQSYICERFIYFQDRSVYFAAAKNVDRYWEYYKSLIDTRI